MYGRRFDFPVVPPCSNKRGGRCHLYVALRGRSKPNRPDRVEFRLEFRPKLGQKLEIGFKFEFDSKLDQKLDPEVHLRLQLRRVRRLHDQGRGIGREERYEAAACSLQEADRRDERNHPESHWACFHSKGKATPPASRGRGPRRPKPRSPSEGYHLLPHRRVWVSSGQYRRQEAHPLVWGHREPTGVPGT